MHFSSFRCPGTSGAFRSRTRASLHQTLTHRRVACSVYALLYTSLSVNSPRIKSLRTLCQQTPGVGVPTNPRQGGLLSGHATVTTGSHTGHGSRVTGHESRVAASCCRRLARPMIEWRSDTGGDTVSTEAVAARRHAGTHLAATWWKLELPTTTWHLLLN